MAGVWKRIRQAIERHGSVALVSVVDAKGSVPCEAGARIVAQVDGFSGTIGGGRLEYEALADAQAMLAERCRVARSRSWPLGPGLGQCCGGAVTTLTEVFDARDLATVTMLEQAEANGPFSTIGVRGEDGRITRRIDSDPAPITGRPDRAELRERFGENRSTVLLFGAGHVGRALVLALAPLPFRVRWIDSRPDPFPQYSPENVTLIRSQAPAAEIDGAPPGAFVVVLTHSHAIDFSVTARALQRADLGFVGLIGSNTKRERFVRTARQMGLAAAEIARLVCPIGIPEITGKEPAIIAASCAAQLIIQQQRSAVADGAPSADEGGKPAAQSDVE
jgi:xanthine dehydrogenase accessory factor